MSDALEFNLPLVVPPNGGKVIRAFGAEMIFHITGEQTGDRSMLATILAPPGQGPPLHYHEKEDECFFVLEGRMSFYADGQWRKVEPGTVVFAPKMSVHSLKNVGETMARVLCAASPAGFEIFFARCEKEFQKPGGPDMARIIGISAEHGIHYV
ncbi:MAG: cupin domain-containing protein [Methylacidiphilales bacterium]|nr:cupin domain-containing protein [Candidatus Methylacidiphilales bacterium]